MYAQVMYLDGPRSAELVAAGERAGLERITPTLLADPQTVADHIATFVLRGPDGAEMIIAIARTEAAHDRANELIMSSQLLPGEDKALLPGPDRVERYRVVHAIEHGHVVPLGTTEDVSA
jgi:hypothetical protein